MSYVAACIQNQPARELVTLPASLSATSSKVGGCRKPVLVVWAPGLVLYEPFVKAFQTYALIAACLAIIAVSVTHTQHGCFYTVGVVRCLYTSHRFFSTFLCARRRRSSGCSQVRITASVLKQDSNTYKVKKNIKG